MTTRTDSRAEQRGSGSSTQVTRLIVVTAILAGIFLLGFAIAGFINTGYHTRYLADDYCIAAHINSKGLIDAQAYWYTNWTGRFGFVFLSDLVVWLGLDAMPLYAPLFILCLLGATSWACYQAGQMLFSTRSVLASTLAATTMVFAYLSLMPDRDTGLYWLAGGANYSAPLVLMALNAGVIALGVRVGGRAFRVAYFATFALAFVSSGFAETFIVWHLVLLSIFAAFGLFLEERDQRERFLDLLRNALLGALIGAAVVIFSPGNEVRQESEGPTGDLVSTVQRSITDSIELLGELLIRPESWVVAGIIFVLTAALKGSAGPRVAANQLLLRVAVVLVITYALLVATFAPGYYFLGSSPPARALAMGALSVVFGMAGLGCVMGRGLAPRLAGFESRPRVLASLVILGVVLLGAAVLHPALSEFGRTDELSAYASAWDARDQQLRLAAETGVSEVTVPILTHDSGLELRTNSRVWMNACAASYYGLRRITAE